MRPCPGRKHVRGSPTPMPVPLRPGTRCSMHFVSDTFGASRKFRIPAINDDFCSENLCLFGNSSIGGERVTRADSVALRLKALGNRTPVQARRAFELDEGSTLDVLELASQPSYQTDWLSLCLRPNGGQVRRYAKTPMVRTPDT